MSVLSPVKARKILIVFWIVILLGGPLGKQIRGGNIRDMNAPKVTVQDVLTEKQAAFTAKIEAFEASDHVLSRVQSGLFGLCILVGLVLAGAMAFGKFSTSRVSEMSPPANELRSLIDCFGLFLFQQITILMILYATDVSMVDGLPFLGAMTVGSLLSIAYAWVLINGKTPEGGQIGGALLKKDPLLKTPLYWLAIFPFIMGSSWIVGMLCKWLEWPVQQNPMIVILFESGIGGTILLIVTAVILAPIIEEVIFRGYLFRSVRKFIPVGRAAMLTVPVWAVLHPPAHWIPLLVLGVALCYLYERTGSLVTVIAVHAIHNGFTMAMALCIREGIQ